jgi:hypothetical protein
MAEPVIVAVQWYDAWADAHENVSLADASERHKPTLMETLGWLVRDTEVGVSIFNERCLDQGEESYRGRTFIPRAMVRSVTPVIKPRKARQKPTESEP